MTVALLTSAGTRIPFRLRRCNQFALNSKEVFVKLTMARATSIVHNDTTMALRGVFQRVFASRFLDSVPMRPGSASVDMKKFQTQNQDTNRGRDLDCITGPRPQNLSRKAVPFFFGGVKFQTVRHSPIPVCWGAETGTFFRPGNQLKNMFFPHAAFVILDFIAKKSPISGTV